MSSQGIGYEYRFSHRAPRSLYGDEREEADDRVAALFNAAWYEVARGAWREAEATLARLLRRAPDDGEALVLLAKVHVARGRLSAALEAIDAARDVGCDVDPKLREAIVTRVGRDPAVELGEEATPSVPAPNIKDAVVARQRSFRLRTENEALKGRVVGLEREVRRWIFATMGVCVTATGFVTWALVPSMPQTEAAPTRIPALASVMPVPILPTAPEPSSLAEVADEVVPHVTTTLSATLRSGVAIAEGELADYRERRAIAAAWLALPQVRDIDWTGVTVTSRAGGRVLVQPGDTLGDLALRYYGDEGLATHIARGNHLDGQGLMPGQFLAIPPAP